MAEPLVRVKVDPIASLRNERGQYTSIGVSEQLNRNRYFAEYLRQQLGLRIENHIRFGKRASASTGRLLRASTSEGNTIVTKEFVGIGRPDFLDKSQAKYWRTFEEGSAAVWSHPFVGTRLYMRGRAPYPVAHGENPGIRTSMRELDDNGGRAGGARIMIVKHEIAPANIYRTLAEANRQQVQSFSVQSARAYLARVFGEANLTVRGRG